MGQRPELRGGPPPTAVLDSEALSALGTPTERGSSARRAQAVLEVVERRGGSACVPAAVLVEVCRGRTRTVSIARVLRRVPVIPTDRSIAERAGSLLERHGLDSGHAVDALVMATAARLGPAVVLTGDPDDLRRLGTGLAGVVIQPLP